MTAAELPRRLRNLPLADVMSEAPQQRRGSAPLRSASRRVPVAVNLPSRLLGLAFLRPGRAGAGLLMPRSRSVHTFGMRFPLDLVFLDAGLTPVSFQRSVRPWRVACDRRAAAVLELPAEGRS